MLSTEKRNNWHGAKLGTGKPFWFTYVEAEWPVVIWPVDVSGEKTRELGSVSETRTKYVLDRM